MEDLQLEGKKSKKMQRNWKEHTKGLGSTQKAQVGNIKHWKTQIFTHILMLTE